MYKFPLLENPLEKKKSGAEYYLLEILLTMCFIFFNLLLSCPMNFWYSSDEDLLVDSWGEK